MKHTRTSFGTKLEEFSHNTVPATASQTKHAELWHAWARYHHYEEYDGATLKPKGEPPTYRQINSGEFEQVQSIALKSFLNYGAALRSSTSHNAKIVYYV